MDDERLKRLETRLVQLMIWLGADPHGPNPQSGFITNAKEVLNGNDGDNSGSIGLVSNWNQLDRPAYLRRRGECPKCARAASEGAEGDSA